MQREGLIEKKATRDVVTYSLTERGEDAVFILLAFLRYGLKHHVDAQSISARVLPTFKEMMREYDRLPRRKLAS
jgi:DNA-binding HxlR family transcriptional regulator